MTVYAEFTWVSGRKTHQSVPLVNVLYHLSTVLNDMHGPKSTASGPVTIRIGWWIQFRLGYAYDRLRIWREVHRTVDLVCKFESIQSQGKPAFFLAIFGTYGIFIKHPPCPKVHCNLGYHIHFFNLFCHPGRIGRWFRT